MDEVRDRYGPPPDSVLNLGEYASIRVLADRIGLESIDREGHVVVLKFRADARLDPAWLYRVVQERADVTLVPPASLKLDLKGPSEASRVGSARSAGRKAQDHGMAGRKAADPVAAGSWWAARARAGEVAPGFTRDQILRPAKEDPRGESGVFSRVGGLLRELSAGGSID
jgi:hypothetical protein